MWKRQLQRKYARLAEQISSWIQKYFDTKNQRYFEEADYFQNQRLAIVISAFISVLGFYITVLIAMTITNSNDYHRLATHNNLVNSLMEKGRINITDRNGEIVATDLRTMSLYVRLSLVDDPLVLASEITNIFPDLDIARLVRRLESRHSGEMLIRKNLSPQEQSAVIALNQGSLFFQEDLKRVYPKEPLMGHIIGYTDIDNTGISGMELLYDDYLSDLQNPPLKLSLDARLQNVVRNNLLQAITKVHAQGASAVLTHIQSGEILAAVSVPDFDANYRNSHRKKELFFQVTQGVYEIGSVFKIFTLANGYENGTVQVGQKYDVSKRTFEQDEFKIKDEYIRAKTLTAEQILAYSSNIGIIQIIQAIGKEQQRAFLKKLGFLEPLKPITFPSLGNPLYPRIWRDSNMITISYGYGLAATPLHVIRAANAIVNNGISIEPTFVLEPTPKLPIHSEPPVVSPETSHKILQAMRLVVTEGTGKAARVEGLEVAGKTGTARRINPNGGYLLDSHTASFIAFFPAEQPIYSLLVIVTDPQMPEDRKHITPGGGIIAAPIVSSIITESLPFLSKLY